MDRSQNSEVILEWALRTHATLRLTLAALALAAVTLARPATAGPGPTAPNADSPGASPAPQAPWLGELPPLPVLKEADERAPTEAEIAQVNATLEALTKLRPGQTREAQALVQRARPNWIPAIERRIREMGRSTRQERVRPVLLRIRANARGKIEAQMAEEGRMGEIVTPDYLDMLIAYPGERRAAWRVLVRAVGLSRMLVALGTPDAARGLIGVRRHFGEMLRADTQLQLGKLSENAVPALVEARIRESGAVGKWAAAQLDRLKKRNPGEAIQTENPALLAEILRAYGRVRQLNATKLVIAFVNDPRIQVRRAAREAIVSYGKRARFEIRSLYHATTGEKASANWTFERTTQELFAELDRRRLRDAMELLEKAQLARGQGDLEAMRQHLDAAFARTPDLPHPIQVAESYLTYAQATRDEPARARAALTRARLLARTKGGPLINEIDSEDLALEAAELHAQGIIDRALFARVVASNVETPEKEALREALESVAPTTSMPLLIGTAAGIACAGFLAGIIALSRKRRRNTRGQPSGPATQ